MFDLHPFDSFEYLLDLIYFCRTFVVLDIHTGVAKPGGLIYPVTASCLPCLPKIVLADPAKIGKTDISRIIVH